MKIYKQDLEIIKLTSKEILLSFFDLVAPSYSTSRVYRQSINKYLEQRSIDRSNFLDHLKYLKRRKYIQIVVEGKEKYIELTPKGIKHSNTLKFDTLAIKHTAKWDQKWRVVIFDIPEKSHYNRDLFRDSLKRMGFIQIQKSVYAYPFECTKEITFLSEMLNIKKFVTTMISEIIQGEERIIQYFLEEKILQSTDLKVK